MAKSADAFRTISEVADWLGVQTHVLRFWESKFTQVKPVKRAGGRRYYRPNDMKLLGGIQKLLHADGLTIKGVQKVLREKGIAHVSALSPDVDGAGTAEMPALEGTKSEITIDPPQEDIATPATGEVVSIVKPPEDTVDDIIRPSFTDDAVVMPEAPMVENAEPETNDPTVLKMDDASVSEVDDASEPPLPPVENDQTTADSEAGAETFGDEPQQSDSQVELTETSEELVAEADVEEPDELETVVEASPEAEPDIAQTTESAIEPDQAGEVEEVPVLPSFLSRSTLPTAPETDNLPPKSEAAVAEQDVTAPEPEAAAEMSKPRIIDIPDTPNDDEIAATPRTLGALASVKAITPAQADAIAPLVAQLREMRDRMAQDRKE